MTKRKPPLKKTEMLICDEIEEGYPKKVIICSLLSALQMACIPLE